MPGLRACPGTSACREGQSAGERVCPFAEEGVPWWRQTATWPKLGIEPAPWPRAVKPRGAEGLRVLVLTFPAPRGVQGWQLMARAREWVDCVSKRTEEHEGRIRWKREGKAGSTGSRTPSREAPANRGAIEVGRSRASPPPESPCASLRLIFTPAHGEGDCVMNPVELVFT